MAGTDRQTDLDGVAASLRELGGIQTSPCTALAKTQAGILSLYTDTTAQYLDFLKQAKSVEDLIATQAHVATGVQDKLKTYSLDSRESPDPSSRPWPPGPKRPWTRPQPRTRRPHPYRRHVAPRKKPTHRP